MKRVRPVDDDKLAAAITTTIDWRAVPDDVIDHIINQLAVPLQKKERPEKKISEEKEIAYPPPNHFESCAYTYFNMFTVSKRFNRAASKLDFDWFALVGSPYGNYHRFRYEIEKEQKRQEAELTAEAKEALARQGLPYLSATPKKMLRTLVCCDNALPVIREEINCFIRTHQLGYRSKKIGRRYNPLTLGIRKLKTIKVQPLSADVHFKALIKRHEAVNKKRLAVNNALDAYAEKLRPTVLTSQRPFFH